jgi:hypothetical protein
MLTYIQINAAKPRAKAWNLSDSQGLYLVIQPNGSKLWRFNYRFLDKQKKLHLGGWPTISLADARVRRDEAKKKIAEGIDPALEKKRARIAAKYAAANTFEAVAEEWLVKCERDGLAPVTVDKIRWLLAKAYPLIGTIPIAQITPHEALAVLRKVEANAVNQGLRKLGYTTEQMTAHGFRAMAATLLNEMGEWNPDAIERQLAHVDTNQVRRAYARGEYWDERVVMMQRWSDYLDILRDGGKILRPVFGRTA